MKKILFIVILSIYCLKLSSQHYSSNVNKIMYLIDNGYYYDAIEKMDIFISNNPKTNAEMCFNRGLIKLHLNDVLGAKEDFIKAKTLGIEYAERIIKSYTSKRYMVEKLARCYTDIGLLKASNNFKPIYSLKDSLKGALRPERTCYDVYYYNLTVRILPKIKSISGSNQIYFRTITDTKKIQIDLTDKLNISSINYNGKELKYIRKFDAVFIEFEDILLAKTEHKITIAYSGKPRIAPCPPWDGGFVWEKFKLKWWIGVACEHLGASSWWPCKDHLTEKPDSMTINVQAPNGYEAVSNGNLLSKKPADENYTNFEWFVSYPINNYCVTFYIGKFVNFNEVYSNANGSFMLDYYVHEKNLRIAQCYYKQTKDIVSVFEKIYGEYPYKKDGIAMVESPFRGMEHQGAIAIGADYENYTYDYLLIHETAHEWWGNTVTMSDFADAWISEAFATYSEALYLEENLGYPEYIENCANTMIEIVNIWPIVGNRDVNENTFIGGDIYTKGAAMLNNLRCIINDDSLFFAMIKGFYTNFKFKTVSTNDFVNHVEKTTGKNLTDFFNKFLYDTVPPILEYQFNLNNNNLYFVYKWTNVGKDFNMPFSLTYNNISNIRLNGTTEYQAVKILGAQTFYLPNEHQYNKYQVSPNSFTYYWTHWKQGKIDLH